MKRLSLLSTVGLLLLNACSVQKGMNKMEKNTEEMNETTQDMNETTRDMNETTQEMNATTQKMEQKTTSMSEDTKEVRRATEEMLEKTSEMSATTKEMQQSTEQVAAVTAEMAATTEGMAETTEGMADTTSRMAETTEGMADTTSRMAETTEGMAETTENMAQEMETMSAATADLQQTSNDLRTATINLYDDNRQGAALELRSNARQFMKGADDQLAKLGYAAQYFMAFEFQLWKGVYSDDSAKLTALKRDAVDEFIRTVYEFLPARRSVSPLATSQSMKNLYALTAALHVVNSNGMLRAAAASDAAAAASPTDDLGGEGAAASSDIGTEGATVGSEAAAPAGVLSMLQLLEDGLAAKASLESGELSPENLEPYQKSVLEHEGVVIYVLQLRSNFISAMIGQLLATSDGQSLGFFSRASHILFRWTAKTSSRNLVELGKYLELLHDVQATQDFLAQIGAPAPLDGKLKRFLRKMRFDEAELQSANATRAETVRALQDAVAKLVQ